jgi:phenylalanyl-tRNA synthetase beta chain
VIEILEHTADAELEGIVDVYPKKIKPWKIRLDLKYVDSLLGEEVPVNHVIKILNLLGVEVKSQKSKVNKILECIIPTIRLDLRTPEDLIEEIGRLWGYEKIEPQPLFEVVTPPAVNKLLAFSANIKERLVMLGFDEMYNYSFYSKKDAEKCGLGDINHFELANPMNPDQELVRASLAPNILKNIENNLKYSEDLRIFEIGRAYFPNDNSAKEKRFLTMARVAQEDEKAQTFYALKSSLSALFESVGIKDARFNAKKRAGAMADPDRIAEIVVNNTNIGAIGEIKRPVLDRFKIKKRVAMAEIDLENFFDRLPKEKTYSPLRKFPVMTRDISLIADLNNSAADIEKFIKAKGGNLVLSVELFDVFQKESKNSLAFRVTFGADRTLESDEADQAMEKIISSLEKELKVEIRK